METYTAKQALRKDMASRKKEYSRITLCELSDKIMDRLGTDGTVPSGFLYRPLSRYSGRSADRRLYREMVPKEKASVALDRW